MHENNGFHVDLHVKALFVTSSFCQASDSDEEGGEHGEEAEESRMVISKVVMN